MNIYKIDTLYYTAAKLMRHLRSLNAQVTDWDGNTYAVRDLDDDRLIGIIEWGNRHECEVYIPARAEGLAELLPVLAEEAKTITVETINVMDITE